MDWQIRVALLVAGLALVGYIFFDYNKKKKIQQENNKLKRQFTNIEDQVDSAGFDMTGVGAARPANDDSEDLSVANTPVSGISLANYLEKNEASQQADANLDTDQQNEVKTIEEALETSHPNPGLVSSNPDIFDGSTPEVELNAEPELVFTLILQATNGQKYRGSYFLPILLSQGLRHGEMGIFHRYQNTGGKPRQILFSLANAITPGTFTINNLESFETPAFALFMTLPGPPDAQIAYDAMVKTVQLLKTELGGDILDETRSHYTEQVHNHRLDSIQEYIRKTK